jgi:hypothetical protein
MRRIKTLLVAIVLLAVAAMLTQPGYRNEAFAADFTCRLSSECLGVGQCSGDKWMKTGTCSISCLKETSTAGELVVVSGANCGGSGGRAGDSSLGSN